MRLTSIDGQPVAAIASDAVARRGRDPGMTHDVQVALSASPRPRVPAPLWWALDNRWVPTVVETTARGERTYDIWSLLLKERIILIGRPIDDIVANLAIAQLLYLAREDPEKEITLYLNTPGGSVTAGLAIYDTMQLIQPPVSTHCLGLAASMGAVLLAAGAPGRRYALANSTVLLHQASAGLRGTAADLEVRARYVLRMQQRLKEILAYHTGQDIERITRDINRDFFMTAQQAKEYGIVDEVIGAPLPTVAR